MSEEDNFYRLNRVFPLDTISKKINQRISQAMDIAETSDFITFKLGAIIEIKGRIFDAPNLYTKKTNVFRKCVLPNSLSTPQAINKYIEKNNSLHAEVNAMLKVLKDNTKIKYNKKNNMSNSTLYVVRLMKDTTNLPSYRKYRLGNSKPCAECQSYLHKYGISKIYYIDDDESVCELKIIN
jgi:deoxycytidylate deaminase